MACYGPCSVNNSQLVGDTGELEPFPVSPLNRFDLPRNRSQRGEMRVGKWGNSPSVDSVAVSLSLSQLQTIQCVVLEASGPVSKFQRERDVIRTARLGE